MEQIEERLITYYCYETIDEFCDEALHSLLKNKKYKELTEKRKQIKKDYPNVKDILEGNSFMQIKKSESKKIYEFLKLIEEQNELEKREIFIRGMKEAYGLFKRMDILK